MLGYLLYMIGFALSQKYYVDFVISPVGYFLII